MISQRQPAAFMNPHKVHRGLFAAKLLNWWQSGFSIPRVSTAQGSVRTPLHDCWLDSWCLLASLALNSLLVKCLSHLPFRRNSAKESSNHVVGNVKMSESTWGTTTLFNQGDIPCITFAKIPFPRRKSLNPTDLKGRITKVMTLRGLESPEPCWQLLPKRSDRPIPSCYQIS